MLTPRNTKGKVCLFSIAYFCLSFLPGHLAADPAVSAPVAWPAMGPETWKAGVDALKRKDDQQAQRVFSDWIESAEKSGIRSSEAHYNLGLAHWNLKHPGQAVYEVLKSATLTASPVTTLERLNFLDGMQDDIGIHDGLPRKLFFKLYLLINRDGIVLLSCLVIWSVCGFGLWRWIRRRPFNNAIRGFFALPVLMGCLAAGAAVNHEYLFRYGVLDGSEKGIPLFRSAGDEATKKLIDLPAGTIVAWEPGEKGFVKISYPVVGWVEERDLRRLD